MTRGTANSCFGEQRDDEVVLVVAGRRDDDVAALEARPPSATRPRTRRATTHLDAGRPAGAAPRRSGSSRGAAPRDRSSTSSLAMNVADVAGPRDRDPHQWWPSRRRCRVEALVERVEVLGRDDEVQDVALLADEVGARGSARRPSRVTDTSVEAAGLVELARARRPAQAAGGRARRGETWPVASVQLGRVLAGQEAPHAPGRSSTRPSRRSGCRAAGRSPRGGGRRCGRRPARSSKVSRATRADMMFELSPLVTAASAPASVDAAPRSSVSRSKPNPTIVVPAEAVRQAPERLACACRRPRPCGRCFSRSPASSLPTRPHPTTTTCTMLRSRNGRRTRMLAAAPAVTIWSPARTQRQAVDSVSRWSCAERVPKQGRPV